MGSADVGVHSGRIMPALSRAVFPAALAVILGLAGRRSAAIGLGSAAGLICALTIVNPALADSLDRGLAKLTQTVSTVLITVLAAAGWILGVMPIWIWHKLVGHPSPQDPAHDVDTNWIWSPEHPQRDSRRVVTHASNSGGPDAAAVSATRARSVLGFAVVILALVLIFPLRDLSLRAIDLVTRSDVGRSVSSTKHSTASIAREYDDYPITNYAHENEPWAPLMFGEYHQLPYVHDQYLAHRLTDFSGKYVNVVDGRRVTFEPDGPELTIWYFGGSTMFGIGQRDMHTIPSVIAELAEHDGLRLRSLNFGDSGYVNWSEVQQFQQALTSDLPKADLAVFYDGVNDFGLGSLKYDIGATDPNVILRYPEGETQTNELRFRFGSKDPIPWSRSRIEGQINSIATQYRRGVQIAENLGRVYKVGVVNFWQPQPLSKAPKPSDDELWKRMHFDVTQLDDAHRQYVQSLKRADVDTIDLTQAMDDVDVPVYFDSSHTNELGARVAGKAIYERLKPTLEKLARH